MARDSGAGKIVPMLLLALTTTLVFQTMLFVTGRISIDEALDALGVRQSDEKVVASLRDETLQSSELLLQWESLLTQRDLLRAESRELLTVEARLSIDQENVAAERSLVQGLMAALTDTLSVRRDAEVTKLAKLYDSMKPIAAARVLKGLDSRLAAEVLARLKPRQSARILAALDPSRAVELSNLLSGNPVPQAPPEREIADGR